MQFHEAELTYRALRERLAAGTLNAQDFSAQANALRFQGADGVWWQVNPNDGSWLRWDGAAWVAGTPAVAIPPVPPAAVDQPPPLPDPAAMAESSAGTRKSMGPLRRFILARSERWWDLFSIGGGSIAGYLWYYYSTLDKNAVPDKSTAWLIAGIPLALVIFRRLIDRLIAPIYRIVDRFIPRVIRIGAALAVPFFLAHKLSPRFTESRNYDYVRYTLLSSVVASYILIRNPSNKRSSPQAQAQPQPSRPPEVRVN